MITTCGTSAEEFIKNHHHFNYCEAIVYPDGTIEYAYPSHQEKLIAITEIPRDILWKLIKESDDVLEWLCRYTKCVPVRLRDLYHGFELQACLEIVDALNKGCSLKEAKNIIDNQGHSGMSFGLVCTMVNEFSKRGREFVEYVNPGFFKD